MHTHLQRIVPSISKLFHTALKNVMCWVTENIVIKDSFLRLFMATKWRVGCNLVLFSKNIEGHMLLLTDYSDKYILSTVLHVCVSTNDNLGR
jgi:hypothetical protein